MAKSKEKKKKELEAILDLLGKSKVAVFANYQGFKMNDFRELRGRLAVDGAGECHVVKNNLFLKALLEQKIEGAEKDLFSGPVAVTFGFGDEVAPVKITKKYFIEKEKGSIIGGIFENKIVASSVMEKLASLPTLPELQAKLMGSMKSPASGLVSVLSGTMRNLVYALSAITKK